MDVELTSARECRDWLSHRSLEERLELACRWAASVLPIVEAGWQGEKSPRKAIAVARSVGVTRAPGAANAARRCSQAVTAALFDAIVRYEFLEYREKAVTTADSACVTTFPTPFPKEVISAAHAAGAAADVAAVTVEVPMQSAEERSLNGASCAAEHAAEAGSSWRNVSRIATAYALEIQGLPQPIVDEYLAGNDQALLIAGDWLEEAGK